MSAPSVALQSTAAIIVRLEAVAEALRKASAPGHAAVVDIAAQLLGVYADHFQATAQIADRMRTALQKEPVK